MIEQPISFSMGRYTVLERLGEGGFAIVYLAFDSVNKRQVAIKVLKPAMSSGKILIRFRNEGAVALRFNHPKSITVYDHDTAKKSYDVRIKRGRLLEHTVDGQMQPGDVASANAYNQGRHINVPLVTEVLDNNTSGNEIGHLTVYKDLTFVYFYVTGSNFLGAETYQLVRGTCENK